MLTDLFLIPSGRCCLFELILLAADSMLPEKVLDIASNRALSEVNAVSW